jgi:hypothetical protein
MTNSTTDHQTIRKWINERGGVPAVVNDKGDNTEILRVDFPDADNENENLVTVTWERFFEIFDQDDLAFLYQNETDDGSTSRFNKFVRRENM